jgi:site-specific recombinase XerD
VLEHPSALELANNAAMAARRRSRPNAPHPKRQPAWATAIPGPGTPLPDRVEQFLDWMRVQRNRPTTTVRAYRQDLAKFVAFMHRRRPDGDFATALDRESLRRYQIELAEVVPNARSRARALVALRRFLAYSYDEGWIASELSRQVTVPRYVMGDPHPVPTADVPRLLAALPSDNLRDLRDRALVHLLLSTGCRISEALSLNRSEVQPEGFRVLGKGGKYRSVYCTPPALAAVGEYLAVRGPDESEALFISVARADLVRGRARAGNRLTPDGARRALAALRRRVGADPDLFPVINALRTPHAARHTTATTLLEATDGDVRLVQEVLGHATLETLRVYTEITDRRKRSAYERLDEYLEDLAGSARR